MIKFINAIGFFSIVKAALSTNVTKFNSNVCKNGKGFDSRSCVSCPAGTYSVNGDHLTICSLVPPGNIIHPYLSQFYI